MNATDVIGWIVDGEYYCVNCSPTNEEDKSKDICDGGSAPIFCGSETDSFNHCSVCEELIPETLTSEGFDRTVDALRDFLTHRVGRPTVMRQWAEKLKDQLTLHEEHEVVGLVILATDEVALKAATHNEMIRMEGVKSALNKAGECEKCEHPTCRAVRQIKEMFHVR